MEWSERRERTLREYSRIEEKFLELTEYVPLTSNLDDPNYQFGSPRAAEFGLDCCTWLETLFYDFLNSESLNDFPDIDEIRKKELSMNVYRDVLEKRFAFSKGGWKLKYLGGDEIHPFSLWAEKKNPDWFRIYSKHKHNRFELAERFTMRHALEALVALSMIVQHGTLPGGAITHESKVLDGFLY